MEEFSFLKKRTKKLLPLESVAEASPRLNE
jgi:hypothetical protein